MAATKREIADLPSEDATWSAIMAAATTVATIRNNQFVGGSQLELACNTRRGDVPQGAMSTIRFNTAQEVRFPVLCEAADISGHIEIEGNYFHGQVREHPERFDPTFGASSIFLDEEIRLNGLRIPIDIVSTTAQAIGRENDFENIQWGLTFIDNSGEIHVERNRIVFDPEDTTGDPIGFVHAGIEVESSINAMKDPVVITGNGIFVRVRMFDRGIYCSSKAATIKDNTLMLSRPRIA